MAQGDLPPIRGASWRPESTLTFVAPLPAAAARSELLRFIGERHPGHLLLVAEAWAAAIGDVSSFDEEAWDTFSAALVDAIDERSTV